jgi:nucleotide-binding universal stress UspA family protein
MKKVLIALDYDPTAEKVAEVGFSMARALNAKIFLLHVITDPVYYAVREYTPITGFSGYMDLSPFQMDTIEGLRVAANHYLDKVKGHLGDETVQTLVKEGNIPDSILHTAYEVQADIIVMGSHSKKWLESVVMGSVTEKVFHHTTLPLFIVPTKKH